MSQKKYYIGLSVTFHDPALAIVDEQGEVLFAEASERYLQYKRALNCEPDSLLRIGDLIQTYCAPDADFVVAVNWQKKRPFYETFCALSGYFNAAGLMRPRFAQLSTFLEKYKLFHMLACQRNSMAKGGINLARRLRELAPNSSIRFIDYDHHRCHAAMACYSSPFQDAVCMVADSYGERGSLAFYQYENAQLKPLQVHQGIESLGFLYMKLTELCGFDWLKGEEWKVMGLAPYGKLDKTLYASLKNMLAVQDLNFRQNIAAIEAGFAPLVDQKNITTERAADIAHTGQQFFTDLMNELVRHLADLRLSEHLVLAGGCALNSSFNGQILARSNFQQLHVPSAPADDGTALGAAWLAWREAHPNQSTANESLSPYLGSELSPATVQRLVEWGPITDVRHLPYQICQETARLLAEGKLVGWVQGRAEFGPRALGSRSILADPRSAAMKDRINRQVKFRESFRPFAPSILHEFGPDYFEHYQASPYMERTLYFHASVRDRVPAVVHVDGTGRLQTVKRAWNQRFYDLIHEFHEITGVPILLNTSFNVMGKPMVHTVEDAVSVFCTSGLDALVIGDYLFLKPGVKRS